MVVCSRCGKEVSRGYTIDSLRGEIRCEACERAFRLEEDAKNAIAEIAALEVLLAKNLNVSMPVTFGSLTDKLWEIYATQAKEKGMDKVDFLRRVRRMLQTLPLT